MPGRRAADYRPQRNKHMKKLDAIKGAKSFRQRLDEVLQDMKTFRVELLGPCPQYPGGGLRQLPPGTPTTALGDAETDLPQEQPDNKHEAIAQHTISIRDLESAIMRQGMLLKAIGNPAGVPVSSSPEERGRAAYEKYCAAIRAQNTEIDDWDAAEDIEKEAWIAAFGSEPTTGGPYPQSYNPNSPVVEPTADNLKL
jgi:hypothetical protein